MESRFQKFIVYMTKILRMFGKIRSQEMEKRGLKPTHLNCLFFLKILEGKTTAHELSSTSGEDKASVSRALSELEKMGYVKSDSCVGKKYNTQIRLTPAGDVAAEDVVNRVNDFMEKGSDGISEKEREIFYASLEKICDNLETLCEVYQPKKGEKNGKNNC